MHTVNKSVNIAISLPFIIMSLHKLDFIIKDESYPLLVATLDGKEEPATLEDFAFIKSTESDGLFPILNCTCGEWGCGGYWVKVKHEGDKVIWEKIRTWGSDKNVPRLHVIAPIEFDKKEYLELANRMLDRVESNENHKKYYEQQKEEFEKTGKFFWAGFSAPEGEL